MNQIDFMASFSELLEQPLEDSQGIDSRSHLGALLGESVEHVEVLYEESHDAFGVRKGEWKFIQFHNRKTKKLTRAELYNLKDDIGESKNVIKDHPEIVEDLKKEYKALKEEKGLRLQ